MMSKPPVVVCGALRGRLSRLVAGLALGAASCSQAYAQASDDAPPPGTTTEVAAAYPSRPIRLMVPDTQGGVVDSIAATLAQHLGDRLGQYVLVDNLSSSSEQAVADAAAQAPPDGYTLVIGTHEGLILGPLMQKDAPHVATGALVPVATLFSSTYYLMVNNWLRAKSVGELIKLAKSQPGKLTYTSSGRGSSDHLAAELFRQRAAIKIRYVARKGNTPAINELLGGKVDIMFEAASVAMPHVQSRKLRALASTGEERTTPASEVPALNELLPPFSMKGWIGLFAPRGVQAGIVEKLNNEVEMMLALPATQQEFARLGIDVTLGTPEDFVALIKSDIPAWQGLLQEAGIAPE